MEEEIILEKEIKTILVVDDEPAIRDLLKYNLSRLSLILIYINPLCRVNYTQYLLLNYLLQLLKNVQFTIVDFEQKIGCDIVKYPIDNLKQGQLSRGRKMTLKF